MKNSVGKHGHATLYFNGHISPADMQVARKIWPKNSIDNPIMESHVLVIYDNPTAAEIDAFLQEKISVPFYGVMANIHHPENEKGFWIQLQAAEYSLTRLLAEINPK